MLCRWPVKFRHGCTPCRARVCCGRTNWFLLLFCSLRVWPVSGHLSSPSPPLIYTASLSLTRAATFCVLFLQSLFVLPHISTAFSSAERPFRVKSDGKPWDPAMPQRRRFLCSGGGSLKSTHAADRRLQPIEQEQMRTGGQRPTR